MGHLLYLGNPSMDNECNLDTPDITVDYIKGIQTQINTMKAGLPGGTKVIKS